MANKQLAQEQLPPLQKATPRRRSTKLAAASQRLSRSKAAKGNQPLRKPAPPTKVNPVVQLIQKQPLVIWGFSWATVLLVAFIAVLGLTNPGTMKTVESSETENLTVAENPLPQAQDRSQLPSWLFGLAGLGCATGAWIVIKQFKGSRRRRRIRKPVSSRVSTTSKPIERQQQANGSSPKRAVPKSKVAPRPVSGKLALADGARGAGAAKVPQKQPKNNKKNSKLVESIDLRKRHPLSSFLRKL